MVNGVAGSLPAREPEAASPFAVRGVIEGFYGAPYTFPQRNDLIRFMGRHGFNLYLYAPKNDRQSRSRWWEQYPARVMARFEETVAQATAAGVRFGYAISPVASLCYSAGDDGARLAAKLRAFYDLGVRAFVLALDDMAATLAHPADRATYGTPAAAHAALSNRLYDWLLSLDPDCTLALCPVDYCGRPPFSPYLHELGERLSAGIDIFYTGVEVCAPAVTRADVAAFGEALHRPPILWDNYPANDLAMQPELHIGPVRGRAPDLPGALRGIVVNPMTQPEASKIPLATYADYLARPAGYDPGRSWAAALEEVAGPESCGALRLLAENSLQSCLQEPDTAQLETLVGEALAALQRGEAPSSSPAVAALDRYLTALDEARYHLTNWLDNLALRADLLPWIELLDLWYWMARRALLVLYALERGDPYDQPLAWMKEWLEAIRRHPKRLAGNVLLPLAGYVLAQVEGTAANSA